MQRSRVFGSGCFEQAQGRSCCSKCSFPSAPGSRVCQTVGQAARGSTRRDARGVWSRRGMRSSYCPREGAVDVFLCDTPVGHPTPALQITSDGWHLVMLGSNTGQAFSKSDSGQRLTQTLHPPTPRSVLGRGLWQGTDFQLQRYEGFCHSWTRVASACRSEQYVQENGVAACV